MTIVTFVAVMALVIGQFYNTLSIRKLQDRIAELEGSPYR